MIKITGLVLCVLLVLIGVSRAEDNFIDRIGFDWQIGRDSVLPSDWQSKHSSNRVYRFCVRLEHDLDNKKWKDWASGLELHYSDHEADEKPDYGQDTGFKELGFNVVVKRYLFSRAFYVGALAGLSYVPKFPEFENRQWRDSDLYSNIGRSHWLVTWGAVVGEDWKLFGSNFALRTECRLSHTSDPFRSDRGKNFLGALLGLTYEF